MDASTDSTKSQAEFIANVVIAMTMRTCADMADHVASVDDDIAARETLARFAALLRERADACERGGRA
jgi:hypothetical protein